MSQATEASACGSVADTQNRPPKQQLVMLDAMRGIAALSVVCVHMHFLLAPYVPAHGYLAVDFFFGLSGLVISRSYGPRFLRGLSAAQFMRMRLQRLYPLYIAGSAIGLLALLASILHNPVLAPPGLNLLSAIGSALLILPSPLSPTAQVWVMPLNAAAWSLVLELAVNLVFALIWRRLTNARLAALIAGAGIVVALCAWHFGNLDLGAKWSTFPGGIARMAFSFFAGVAVGRLAVSAPRSTHWALLLPVALLATMLPGLKLGVPYDLLCVFVANPLLLFLGTRYESTFVAPLRFIGGISYPLYALHSGLLLLAGMALSRWLADPHVSRIGLGLAIFAGLIALAAMAEAYFDRPLRERRSRLRAASRAAQIEPKP